MAGSIAEPLAPRNSPIGAAAGLVLIAVVAGRLATAHYGRSTFATAAGLFGAFLLLFAARALLPRRMRGVRTVYFLAQTGLVQALGLLCPYDDFWGALYIALGFQVIVDCSRREALAWGCVFSASVVLTLSATLGWIAGLGRTVYMIATGLFLIAYDVLYATAEATRRESQHLLAELQQAHHRLQESAAQVEALAAAQERNRLTRELHDSVGQLVFGITLATESARLLAAKNPACLPEQLELLQDLTGRALGQMRILIGRWRPAA